jgi:hypothetical protein
MCGEEQGAMGGLGGVLKYFKLFCEVQRRLSVFNRLYYVPLGTFLFGPSL